MSSHPARARTRDAHFPLGRMPTAPRLTREQELELALRAKLQGDRKAADLLVRAHSRHVLRTALRYRGYGVALNELIAEGNLGLAHALRKFEPSRGLRFATYATYWVRALMLEHIVKNWSIVRGGSRALDTRWFFRLRRERKRVANLGFGADADVEVATRLGLPVEEVRGMVQRLDLRDGALDAPAGNDSSVTLGELLRAPDDQEARLNELQVQVILKDAVARALATLDPRERRIVEWRLMADSSEQSSLAQIGRNLGVSRERAHQLEVRTKQKLSSRIPALGHAVVKEWLALPQAG